MSVLAHKKVIVGITGSIAAYKAAELVRQLREAHAEVRVVMTLAAEKFIAPLTLQALSANPVHSNLLDVDSEAAMSHITLARWADLIIVAPASANCMAKLAHGLADDLLSTLILAANVPVYLAPGMNQQMWLAAATQSNVALLRQRGCAVLGPAVGSQACGEVGPGRLLEPAAIISALVAAQPLRKLAGARVLITAGPTREAIDPVRYISNRSSGKMGYAVASAAVEAGAEVTLVSGPVALSPPPGLAMIRVESAAEMATAVFSAIDGVDIFIAAAAVADYRPTASADNKIKKSAARMTLELTPTTDVLATVAQRVKRPFLVGFAAETESLSHFARDKLTRKQLDIVAANLVGPALGFESDDNALHVLWPGGEVELPRQAKVTLASRLVDIIAERYREKNSAENS